MYIEEDPGSQDAATSFEDIIIDPGVLHEEKKASSALTDIYGVPLFKEEYEQNVLRAREEDALAQETDWDSIFRTIPEGDVYADTVTSLLFMGTQEQVIREEPFQRGRPLLWAHVLVVSAVFFTALLAGIWYREQERRRKRDADIRHVYGS